MNRCNSSPLLKPIFSSVYVSHVFIYRIPRISVVFHSDMMILKAKGLSFLRIAYLICSYHMHILEGKGMYEGLICT